MPDAPRINFRFEVTELDGSKPDLRSIALTEDWAKHLIYCDMDGFALDQDGILILMDECGNMAYTPEGRFRVAILAVADAVEGDGSPSEEKS